MTHRFPIKEIARQSGLGTATVDRVLNNRANVSPQTRLRVDSALAELEAQEQQLAAKGRRLFIDVVVEAPRRFSGQVKQACETVLPQVTEAVYRPRFVMQEAMSEDEMLATLSRILKRGSHGILLKARDLPAIRDKVDQLEAARIPVVTLVTDIPHSRRSAYVGIDNHRAGQIAAYLLAKMLPDAPSTILTTQSQTDFQGEAIRHRAFAERMRALRPRAKLIDVSGGGGIASSTAEQIAAELPGLQRLDAVYSMGGGNKAILDLLRAEGRTAAHFIAHDLDAENRDLLSDRKIDFVLHHDLQKDMRHAFQAMSAQHGLVPKPAPESYSDVQIVTPFHMGQYPAKPPAQ